MSKTESNGIEALARDINAVLKPDPPLDVSAADLKEQVVELMPDVKKEDDLTKESFETLKKLGWSEGKPVSIPVGKEVPTEKSPEVKLPGQMKPTKKAKKNTPKAAKAVKINKPKAVGRMESIGVVLVTKGGVKVGRVAELADALYVKDGGLSNIKTSASFLQLARQLIRGLGKWNEKDGVVTIR